ncbi:MAG: ShlB/FhaC/HecB family hemolysin secretion/activation protein [Nitrosomonas sp.]|nr:ShlB/FhaC/HecB family hemolysin secretion/activation protein [Nitrosomonas sp.]
MLVIIFFPATIYGQNNQNQGYDGLRPSEKSLTLPELPRSGSEPTITAPFPSSPPVESSEKQTIKAPEKQIRIELESIVFEGNTVFQDKELNTLVKPYLNTPVSIDELEELRRLITQHYIGAGYVTSGATFPPNPLRGKALHIKIIEGKVDEIRIKGEKRLRQSYIANRLIPDDGKPVNMNDVQDRFRLLLTDPLFDRLNGRLLPGSDRGLSILDVEVTRSRPYQFSVLSDNYRAPSVGAIALGANTWVRNLTGQGDMLDFTFMTSAPSGGEAYQYSGNWQLPLGDYGTQFYFSFNKANVSITEEPLVNLDIKSDTFSVEGGLNQTIINSLQRRLTFGAGLAFKDNETTLLGQPFSFVPGLLNGKNQISVVRINQEYIERWEKFVLALRSTFSIGQDIFGSTIQKNHLNPDSDYFAWLGQMRGLWSLSAIRSDLVIKGTIQVSDDPLLPLERIAVGGRHTVRGYRENQLVRDNGYASSVELHIHLLGSNQSKYRFDLVPFFDHGAAWNNNDSTPTKQTTAHLYSAGIGFQFRADRFSGEFFWAHHLAHDTIRQNNDLQDHGIHFQARIDTF